MTNNWQPSIEERKIIYSFALQNNLEHGQAQMGSIMGKLSQNFDMKKYGKLLPRFVIAEVNKANSLMQREGAEAVKEELLKLDSSKMDRLEREKVKIKRVFPELPNVEQDNFKVRFAPNPNAPLTVGHMRGVLINKYYADKYGGDFILRFDDTSTDVKPPIIEAYIQILKDIKWLTSKAPDDVLIASDRIDIYYDYANRLISMNGAYMCNCKNFKELKDASKPCPHRDLSVEENLELFNKMKQGEFEAGEWVLRARTNLDAPNPAHRDFVLFRVQRNAHPRTGDSYKAWPMLDFQSAIDDHLSRVTHIIRGIDLQDSTAKQKILYSVFDWDYPETTYWGRVKILDQNDNEVRFSSSQYAKDIAEGKFTGWDDKRLYTVQAFKNRGYTPEALLNWWLEYGLTRKPITVSMKTLDTLQKREGKGEVMEAEEGDEINITKTDDTFLQGKLKAALDTWDDDFWPMKLENQLGTYSSYIEDEGAREWMWGNAVYYTPNHPIAPKARWNPQMYHRMMKTTYGENAEEVIKQQQCEIKAPVIAIREYDGFDYLVSGNHRSASQWNAGKKTIPTIILDMSAFYDKSGEDFLTMT